MLDANLVPPMESETAVVHIEASMGSAIRGLR
jgi:hypothetical protein